MLLLLLVFLCESDAPESLSELVLSIILPLGGGTHKWHLKFHAKRRSERKELAASRSGGATSCDNRAVKFEELLFLFFESAHKNPSVVSPLVMCDSFAGQSYPVKPRLPDVR